MQVTIANAGPVAADVFDSERAAEVRTVARPVPLPRQQRAVSLGTLEDPLTALFSAWLRPSIVALSLLGCVLCQGLMPGSACVVVAAAAAVVSRQIFTPLCRSTGSSFGTSAVRMLLQWAAISGLLLVSGVALGLAEVLPGKLTVAWLSTATVGLLLLEFIRPLRARSGARAHRYIVVGANEVGMEFQRREAHSNRASAFLGYFDFREPERLPAEIRQQISDSGRQLVSFVQSHAVTSIYIALPMSNAPRIEKLVEALRDTTASIYFVPDFFAFDPIQARCVELNGLAMLSVCDTPFYGVNALAKRAFDVVFASGLLLTMAPVLLLIALAVKLTSHGPILFKQRRYGLHGEEILVYKFRSMTVCEDGDVVVQARRHDPRVTPVGRWIRAASLDELPQLINVLQGRMSLIGPRPHAVAHNEVYRTLISGYMIRHKVRPGMTGWAQVNGLRGEIGDVEQLRQRVHHDLEYLRNWSLSFDLRILLRTLMLLFRPGGAF